MEHKEFKRIAQNSNIGVLFIHGIVGTPNHFNSFIELLPSDVSVYNILLDGHGKSVTDFSHTSMKKWEAQIENAVKELSKSCDKIYVIAHSMGTLLAIEQAIKCEKIARLFLLAVPLKLFLKPKMVTNSLKVHFNRIKPNDAPAIAAKNCYGIGADKNPLHYLGWIPRFLELFAKIRSTRKLIKSVEIPCAVYQSSKDEMISKKSAKYFKDNPNISVFNLKNSGHYYYPQEDFELLLNEFRKLDI